jgi:PAT family beta-lactamase induction signal transducer AmpG
MLTGQGLIVILGGYLEHIYANKTKAWSYTMITVGVLMVLITIYNYYTTPKSNQEEQTKVIAQKKEQNFLTVFGTFFMKKQIGIVLAFILLFRLGESQLLKMLTPFLIDAKDVGGIGLTTVGIIALVIGGVLGGIAISKQGLGKWMLPMILMMHLPILGFILLSHFHPQSEIFIYLAVIVEQFGYGFGFAAFMMFLIYVAEGESKTSHYAIATGFMALGMMIPGMLSGYIQEYLGYGNFFIWVFIATLPGLILSRFLVFPHDFGKKTDI